jgi:hypothetical protein
MCFDPGVELPARLTHVSTSAQSARTNQRYEGANASVTSEQMWVRIAQQVDGPVKVVWTREGDIR